MRVRETDRNLLLLGSFTLLSLVAAGIVALLDPAPAPASAAPRPVANQVPTASQAPVRVVGIPFVPNTNPRQR
ncbi:hypothetical protein [Bradyrhizobium embrapense]|uniref:hypothetical protein n=1 Tax=Bradyrhizobium embrapense TaxID=630921 RepID=UPI00067DF3B5|nr:hypothetical protein [Bradyrhizobium embrapense]